MSPSFRCLSGVACLFVCVTFSGCGDSTQPAGSNAAATQVSDRVGSAVCGSCHREIHTTYHETVAMARSFYPMNPDNAVEEWTKDNTYFHQRSAFYYRMERRGDRYYQRRWKLDPDGLPVHEFERQITHVMGSGNHVRTYIHYSAGNKATQLPVSWYAETKTWAMSPGYDQANQQDFRRAIDHGCMFCHNAYPDVPAGDITGASYAGQLPMGIDCERCHGNGGRHVALARDDSTSFEEVCDAIVNPAELDNKRAMDVCLQCHLETAVNVGLPHSLRRFDRSIFSFQPGEALEDFLLPFDSATDDDQEERFEIAHHGYRLMQSRCFIASDGEMICTTCHDPHHTPTPADTSAYFRDRCFTCHELDDCSTDHLAPGQQGIAKDDCVHCHMPRRRTIDVVHAVMRDHRIVRRPPEQDLLAAREERHDTYQGDLAFFLPATAPRGAEAELYLGTAYLQGGVHVARGIDMIERALRNGAAPAATPYRMVGLALSRNRDYAGAVAAFEKALEQSPGDVAARSEMGAMLFLLGRVDDARQQFERVLATAPNHTDSLVGLYRIAAGQSDAGTARRLLAQAVNSDPEHNRARRVLARLLLAERDLAGARLHFEHILRLDPRDIDAVVQIGFLDRAAGDWQAALLRAREALQVDDEHRRAALLAAMVYATAPSAALRNGTLALAHVRTALRGQPNASAAVLLIVAAAHAECGDYPEAVRIAEGALGSAQSSGNQTLTHQISERLRAYQKREPWHEPK